MNNKKKNSKKGISRKSVLKMMGASAAAAIGLPTIWKQSGLFADTLPGQVLVNVMLEGGPDFRHIIVPPFDANPSSYGFKYWQNRALSHNIDPNSSAAWQARYENDYTQLTLTGRGGAGDATFGVLNSCGWLISMIQANKVAIVNRVQHSETRNHSQALLAYQKGDRGVGDFQTGGAGWGGSLAEQSGNSILSLTNQVRPFCSRPDQNRELLVSGRDIRNYGLDVPRALRNDPLTTSTQADVVMARALQSYYQSGNSTNNDAQITAESTLFKRFRQNEKRVRVLGESIRTVLNPLPSNISSLFAAGNSQLTSPNFGQQIRDLHDSFNIVPNVTGFNFSVASMNYGGWDTHRDQITRLEPQMNDIFGAGRGLDAFFSNATSTTQDATLFMIGGEFGRQLKANGDAGTDHGRGNMVLLIGNPLNSGSRFGSYETMFPASEIAEYDSLNNDIDGQIPLEDLIAEICNWHTTGSNTTVVPTGSLSNGALDALFT